MRTAFLIGALAFAGACNASNASDGTPAAGAARDDARAEASGPRTSRAFPAGAFDRISLNGPMDVRAAVGGQPSVRAEGEAAALDRLEIAVVDGELRIGTRPGTTGPLRNVVIHVTVPALSAASLNGPGDIDIDRVQGERFTAAVNGPGDLRLAELRVGEARFAVSGPGGIRAVGGARRAEAVLNGPGNLHLDGFEAGDASVTLSGPGDIDLRATGAVAVTLAGPGDVTISGSARCTIANSGPGNVRCPNGG